MRQHHPLRRPRRPARVLQERQRLPVDVGPLPSLRPVGLELGIDLPEDLPQARRRGPQAVEAIEDVAGREGDGGIGVAGDRLDPLNRPILARRVRRNRDRTAVQTAEKSSDEVETRGKEEQHALPGHPRSLEPGTERPSLPVELGVGDVELVLLAVDEERERPVMGAVGRPLPQQVDDRFGERRFGVGIGIHVPWDLRPPTVLEGLTGAAPGGSRHGDRAWETRDSPRDSWDFGRFPGPAPESTRGCQTTGSSGPPGASGRCSAGPATDSPSPVGRGERQSVPVPGATQTLRPRGPTHPGSVRPGSAPASKVGPRLERAPTAQEAHVRPLADSTRGPNLPVNPPMTSQRSCRRTSMSPWRLTRTKQVSVSPARRRASGDTSSGSRRLISARPFISMYFAAMVILPGADRLGLISRVTPVQPPNLAWNSLSNRIRPAGGISSARASGPRPRVV